MLADIVVPPLATFDLGHARKPVDRSHRFAGLGTAACLELIQLHP
jgi:hypothetical protein